MLTIGIRIEKISNGFVVYYDELVGDIMRPVQHCIEACPDDDDGWKGAFGDLCYFINDLIGTPYNGFDKENLRVDWGRIGDEINDDRIYYEGIKSVIEEHLERLTDEQKQSLRVLLGEYYLSVEEAEEKNPGTVLR